MVKNTRSPSSCQICEFAESVYTCSICMFRYCSVSCYKRHKESCGDSLLPVLENSTSPQGGSVPYGDEGAKEPKPLRSLTSLNWPYVPEESAFPDPLKRDDPKPLQLRHYEAIATSPAVRAALVHHPSLSSLLTSLDQLKGFEREHAIHHALGMTEVGISEQSRGPVNLSEEVRGLRELAEAVELAVRGGQDGALGLDWDRSAD